MTIRTLPALLVAGVVALGLAGCGGGVDAGPSAAPAGATERQAAAEPTAAVSPTTDATTAATAAPATGTYGRALGTFVCVENATNTAITVTFTKYDTGDGNTTLQPDARACAEGTFATSPDVAGRITVASGREIAFGGYNPAIGYPRFSLWEVEDDEAGVCATYASGESNTFDNAENQFKITRHEDSGWKRFTVRVSGGRAFHSEGCGRGHGGRL